MATATIVGGATVKLTLDHRESQLAQQALAKAGQGFTTGQVLTSLSAPPTPGVLNVYEISPGTGRGGWGHGGWGDGWGGGGGYGSDVAAFGGHDHGEPNLTLPDGGQVLIVEGHQNVDITGHTGQELLIGNAGNDVINAAGGSGTVIAGLGRNEIELNSQGMPGGNLDIVTSHNPAVIDMAGGSVTIHNGGRDKIEVRGGANTIVGATSKALDINIRGSSSNNNINVNGDSAVKIHAAGDDTIATSDHGKVEITFDHKGGVNTVIDGHSQDRVFIESGDNTITAMPGMHFGVSGGDNDVTVGGGAHVTLSGGTNQFTADGTGSSFVLNGGSDTVQIAAGADDTITRRSGGHDHHRSHSGGGTSTVLLGGNDTLNLVDSNSSISTSGTGDVLDFSRSGTDTVTGDGTLNIAGKGQYTIVVNGNETINFGSGKDTVIHGAATVYGACGHLTVTGGAATPAVGSGQTTLIGGSPTRDFVSSPSSATSLAPAHSSATLTGTALFTFTGDDASGGKLADHFQNGGVHVTLVNYEPITAAKSHGAGSITMDHGHTQITLDGVSHLGASH